jgi:hypothetical protein
MTESGRLVPTALPESGHPGGRLPSRLPWLCHSRARLVDVRSCHDLACCSRAQASEAR